MRTIQHVLPGSRPDGLWGWVMKKLPKDVMGCTLDLLDLACVYSTTSSFIETSISLNECN